jgi:hypothetical protein
MDVLDEAIAELIQKVDVTKATTPTKRTTGSDRDEQAV